jgi:hypothetical protein
LVKKVIIVFVEIFLLGLVFIVGANIWYNNPENCYKCHEVKENYESWKISSHSSISCMECHQDRGLKGILETKFRGISRVMLKFTGMEVSEIKAHVDRDRCWHCHTQKRKKYRVGTVANLVDTHSIHLNKGYQCTDCHAEAVHPDKLMESGMPTMDSCITCHEAENVSRDCSTCHLDVNRHVRIIADLGGLTPDEHDGCKTCHPLINPYDNKIDHKIAVNNVGGWKGSTKVCAKCHPQEMKDMSYTVHSKLKSKVNVKGLTGEYGFINRYCSFCGSTALVNWADQIKANDGESISVGCGKCHIGGNDLPSAELENEIDCFICHSNDYDMSKKVVNKTPQGLKWSWDNSESSLSSIVPPTAENCKRCHNDYMTTYRGTPFNEDTDAHAAKGMQCIQCHTIKNHKIARGNHVTDLWANALPSVAHSCIQCHMNRRHKNNYINIHLKKIACETCHVKHARGIVFRDWTKPQDPDANDLYEPLTESVSEGIPEFSWFNGEVKKSTMPIGTRNDGRSKIYPFKIIKVIIPYDPELEKPLPMKLSVFKQTGDINAAIKVAAEELNIEWSGNWKPHQYPVNGIFTQINHSVSNKGRQCDECHSDTGIMDFQALGYSEEKIKSLKKKR